MNGSLAEYGVTYHQVDLLDDGGFDFDGIRAAINEKLDWLPYNDPKVMPTVRLYP